MRIISGNFKGKKILKPKNLITRPLKDLTKESIFNIINHSNKFSIDLQKSTVLDLFSGIGSFGIECLSRGAKHVTFVDNYSGVTEVLKKNLNSLSNINNYEILERDIIQDLQLINFKKKFRDEKKVPRPPNWSGWRLVPEEIEFWRDGDNRIHERLKYVKNNGKGWKRFLLNP